MELLPIATSEEPSNVYLDTAWVFMRSMEDIGIGTILITIHYLVLIYFVLFSRRYKRTVTLVSILWNIGILLLLGASFTLGHTVTIGPSLEGVLPEDRFISGMYGFGFALFDFYLSCFFCFVLLILTVKPILRSNHNSSEHTDFPILLIVAPILCLGWSIVDIVIYPFQWFWWHFLGSVIFVIFVIWIIRINLVKASLRVYRIAILCISMLMLVGILATLSLIIRATDSMLIPAPDQQPPLSDFLSHWASRNATLWAHSLFYSSTLSLAIVIIVSISYNIQKRKEKSANMRLQVDNQPQVPAVERP